MVDRSKEFWEITRESLQQEAPLVAPKTARSSNSGFSVAVRAVADDIGKTAQKLSNLTQLEDGAQQRGQHSQQVVSTLKSLLIEQTERFKSALESRTASIKAEDDRRSKFGSTRSLGKPLNFVSGVATARKRTAQHVDTESQAASSLEVGDGFTLVPQHQQQYYQTRRNEVQQIETILVDLGRIFGRLAGMIDGQRERVERVDASLDDTLSNVDGAHGQLLRHWSSVSSNKWLIFKVFLILIAFVVFFFLFVA